MIKSQNKEVKLFCHTNGQEPFIQWLRSLDQVAKRIIENRVARLSLGNYGDYKRINKDVLELRLDVGPGYRIYFAQEDEQIVILLCGGNKSTQKKDIEKAIVYYNIYRNNQHEKL